MQTSTNNALVTAGIGAGAAATGGIAFRALHTKVFKLSDDALRRATPGPFLAFGAIGLGVAATDRLGLQLSDKPKWQLAQDAATGAAIFTALTLASPMFHGTKQPLAVSALVNAGLGAVVGGGVHLLTKPD
jgi:hypothetical protein